MRCERINVRGREVTMIKLAKALKLKSAKKIGGEILVGNLRETHGRLGGY